MRSPFGLVVLFLIPFLAAGCSSFYGSSILGHDAVDIPFREVTKESVSMGFTARSSSLRSQYSLDTTSFWRAGPLAVWSSPWEGGKTVVRSLAFTAYQAKITQHQPSDRVLEGRGWTLETKDGVIVPMGAVRVLVAFDALVNFEAGDYRAYRATLDNVRSLNLSPNGISGEAGITAGVILPLTPDVSLEGEWHNGVSSPDLVLRESLLPGSASTVRLRLWALSVAYTTSILSVLNRGDTFQATVRF